MCSKNIINLLFRLFTCFPTQSADYLKMYCIHLFSAAHCLNSSDGTLHPNVVVGFGRSSLLQWHKNKTLNREVSDYRIHPDYMNGISADSDLAILILRMPIEYNLFIKPICLWSGSIDLQNIVNKIGYVAAWDLDNFYSSVPRIMKAPIVSQVKIFIDSEPVFSFSVSFAIRST